MSEYVADLRGAIEEFTPLLEQMSDEATRKRPRSRYQFTQSAMKMFVSCGLASCRFEAQTTFLPSGLNIGNPSKVDAVVTCSSSEPSGLIRKRSKLPSLGSVW